MANSDVVSLGPTSAARAQEKLARFSDMGLASYLVTAGGRVLRANDAITPLSRQVLMVGAGRLRCAARADQARLDDALANAAAPAFVRLTGVPELANPLALVEPLDAGLALTTLVDARSRKTPKYVAMLSRPFGLTARETDIAALVSAGADIAEAARRLGLAIGTARNYLKSVMQKFDVHSQAELAALVGELSRLAVA